MKVEIERVVYVQVPVCWGVEVAINTTAFKTPVKLHRSYWKIFMCSSMVFTACFGITVKTRCINSNCVQMFQGLFHSSLLYLSLIVSSPTFCMDLLLLVMKEFQLIVSAVNPGTKSVLVFSYAFQMQLSQCWHNLALFM